MGARRRTGSGGLPVSRRRLLVLLWLAGIDLRLTVLAVPPLLPQIRETFGLDQATLAALTTLPVLLLALGAPLGAIVVSRVGPRATLVAGLLVMALASALRGSSAAVGLLFALTFCMGVGMATIQPALPALVRSWLPTSPGLGTATYVNGLLTGEVLAAALTRPLLAWLGSWQGALASWSVLVVLTAALLGLSRTPETPGLHSGPWQPDWRSGNTWLLGLLQGSVSAIYFATNTFLPTYLHADGRPDLIGPSLTALNGAQLPASVLLMVMSTSSMLGPPFLALLGVLCLLGLGLVVAGQGAVIVVGAAIVGFASAAGLVAVFTLPTVIDGGRQAHRISAGMFTIGYALAFVLPVLGGEAWDRSGQPLLALLPALAGAVAFLVAGPTVRRRFLAVPAGSS